MEALKLRDMDRAMAINRQLDANAVRSIDIRWSQTQRMRDVLYVNKKGFNLSAYKHGSIQGEVADNIQKGLTELSKFVNEPLLDNLQLVPEMKRIQINYVPNIRSFVTKPVNIPEGHIYLGLDSTPTICHEMGHIIEYNNPEVLNRAMGFVEKRAAGQSPHWLGNGFDKDEVGWNDKLFMNIYIGKKYPDATEVTSMGLQYFYLDPYTMASKDPEYFDLIYNILRGIF